MSQPHSYSRPRRPILRSVLWTLVALAAMTSFIAAAPYVFLAIGHIQSHDWTQFSDEGQAYGGIASVFGMLAIAGVAVSLIMQSRESAANRAQIERTFHADLMYKALDDPELLECWGAPHGERRKLKQNTYVNLIFSFWHAMFEIGRMPEHDVRSSARDAFAGMPAREYWQNSRLAWTEMASDGVSQFIEIVDDAFQEAQATGPASRWPEHDAQTRSTTGDRSPLRGLAVAAICGAAAVCVTTVILHHDRQR